MVSENLRKSGIYKINFPNGKFYIGKSINIERRIVEHNKSHDDLPVHRAIEKYGKRTEEDIEILQEISSEDIERLNKAETYWIDFYKSTIDKNGYNLTVGGDGASKGVYNSSAKLNDKTLNEVYDLLINHKELYIYQIANKYNLSPESVSEINVGKRYYNSNFSYPLREPPKPFQNLKTGTEHHLAKFNDEELNNILNLLKTTVISMKDIAKQFNCCQGLIENINEGKSYFSEVESYPIRKVKANYKFDKKELLQIYKEILTTKKTYEEIAKDHHVSKSTIGRIASGERYFSKDFAYPMRKNKEHNTKILINNAVSTIFESEE